MRLYCLGISGKVENKNIHFSDIYKESNGNKVLIPFVTVDLFHEMPSSRFLPESTKDNSTRN